MRKCNVKTHFRCNNGRCIPRYLIGNNEWDCLYGEDENPSLNEVRILFLLNIYLKLHHKNKSFNYYNVTIS